MLPIAFGPPGLGLLQQLGHIRNHLQGHHYLVEVVEVIGGKQGLFANVSAPHPRLSHAGDALVRPDFVGLGAIVPKRVGGNGKEL